MSFTLFEPRTRWSWLAVPVLLSLILYLWVADSRTPYESRAVMVLLNFFFTWTASFCICILTARGFLSSGQPGLLMFGCGALVWGTSSLSAAVVVDRVNATITIHNLGILAAAVCHFAGLLWHGRLKKPAEWLAAGYLVALTAATLIFWMATAGWTPLFFVQGQGGTPIRQVILAVAILLFGTVAWQMLRRIRRNDGDFYSWYGLGLALVATGLVGVFLLTVQASILGWVNRLTQYLGSVYLLVAALTAAREAGGWKLSFKAVEEAWEKGDLLLAFRHEPLLSLVLRYGLAVLAVAAGFGLREVLTEWVGPGLPTFITFYPAVMLAALLTGMGPGLVATALTLIVTDSWIFPNVGSLGHSEPVERVALVLFAFMGLLMSALSEVYRRNRDKAAAYDREQAVREREELYRKTLHALPAHIAVIDPSGRIISTNPAWMEFAAANQANDMPAVRDGANYLEVCRRVAGKTPEAAQALAGIEAVLAGAQEQFTMEYPCHSPHEQRWFLMTVVPLGPRGRHGAVITHLNITVRKRAEDALQASLHEKEVLLHEVHHRVKNNLQVISSLVSLQSGNITGPERVTFENIRDQVRAMALVHEKLYQAGDFGRIEFSDYARSLLEQLWRVHGRSVARADLVLNLQSVTVPLTDAVPCGLILNELASNALKHAFPTSSDAGRVTVTLRCEPDGCVCLSVADNGAGLPAGLDWRNVQSLGLRLVQMLVHQLGGSIEARSPEGRGAEFEVRFVPRNGDCK